MSDTTTTIKAVPQFTPDTEGLYSMEAAKKLGTAGLRFKAPTGAIGTVLPNKSAKGKLLAELTCTAGGPNHIREVSDWHQCGVSPEMKKKAKKKKVASTATEATTDSVAQAESVRKQLEEKLAQTRVQAGLTTAPSVEAIADVDADSADGEEIPF